MHFILYNLTLSLINWFIFVKLKYFPQGVIINKNEELCSRSFYETFKTFLAMKGKAHHSVFH